jgi:hypothetical protein
MVWRLETLKVLSLTRPKKNHEGNHPLGRIASLHGFEFYLLGYCLTRGFLLRNVFLIYEISNQFKEIIFSVTGNEVLPVALSLLIFQVADRRNPAEPTTLEYMIC